MSLVGCCLSLRIATSRSHSLLAPLLKEPRIDRKDSADFSSLGKDRAPLRGLMAAGASRQAPCRLAFAGQVPIGMPLAMADQRDHGGPFPTRANHPKGWDAKPLAYVQKSLDMAAGLPGEHSISIGLCMSRGRSERIGYGGAVWYRSQSFLIL
jgi:hypothetical protein